MVSNKSFIFFFMMFHLFNISNGAIQVIVQFLLTDVTEGFWKTQCFYARCFEKKSVFYEKVIARLYRITMFVPLVVGGFYSSTKLCSKLSAYWGFVTLMVVAINVHVCLKSY